jgi:hypothetical protein
MTNALILDTETGDLALEGHKLVLGRPQTTIASIVVEANRGELKELPLIGGEANRQLGTSRSGMWLTRLRKMLTAVGLKVGQLTADNGTIQLTIDN